MRKVYYVKLGAIGLETILSMKTCHENLLKLEFLSKRITSFNQLKTFASQHKPTRVGGETRHKSNRINGIKTFDYLPCRLINNSFDIKTAGVEMLCLNSKQIIIAFDMKKVFYCQNSIESSLKSSAILHSETLNYIYSPINSRISGIQRSTPPPPQPKRASYGPDRHR